MSIVAIIPLWGSFYSAELVVVHGTWERYLGSAPTVCRQCHVLKGRGREDVGGEAGESQKTQGGCARDTRRQGPWPNGFAQGARTNGLVGVSLAWHVSQSISCGDRVECAMNAELLNLTKCGKLFVPTHSFVCSPLPAWCWVRVHTARMQQPHDPCAQPGRKAGRHAVVRRQVQLCGD